MMLPNPLRITSLVTLVFIAVATATIHDAHAALVITVQDALIPARGSGSVDVMIRSTDGTDVLAVTNYRLQIEPENTVFGGELFFSPIQTPNEHDDDDYIFGAQAETGNFAALRLNNDPIRLTGTDFVFANVPVPTTDKLLARVELDHIIPQGVTDFRQFRISLVQDPANTFFLHEDFETQAEVDATSFDTLVADTSVNSGLITIFEPSAIPEPSAMVLLGCGLVAWVVRSRRGLASTGPAEC